MIDFHTHVLPGIDDGSRNVEMTISMIAEELAQGVEEVIATPHFYANHSSIDHFLEKRHRAMKKMTEALAFSDIQKPPYIRTGAEVYYFPGMGRAERLPQLCIEGTRTILIEMPFEQWKSDILRDLRDVLERQKLTVVLAHIERYPEFQRDDRVWDEVMHLPVIPQINTGSFLKKKSGLFSRDKKRKFCMQYLGRHPEVILGSDCHNLTSRRPNLADGRAEIKKELGAEVLERVDKITRKVLDNTKHE